MGGPSGPPIRVRASLAGVLELSAADARRLVLAAQGFGKRPTRATARKVLDSMRRVLAVRIDSINVVARAHEIAPFSRVGAYPLGLLDDLTFEKRQLFEGWANGNALIPIELYPVLDYRRRAFRDSSAVGPNGQRLDPRYVDAVLEEIAARGPLAANELSVAAPPRGKWWGWSNNKIAVEHLWSCGLLAIAGREGFVRLYDIAERVIPAEYLTPDPRSDDEAQKYVLCRSAEAMGVASGRVLATYFGLYFSRVPGAGKKRQQPPWPRLIAELVEDGQLLTASIEGWTKPAYVTPSAKPPRTMHARALVSPFDPLMRGPGEEVFGFEQLLAQQLYVPEHRRAYGYYVLPFVLGDEIVARCDLKAARGDRVLLVPGAFLEEGQNTDDVVVALAAELQALASWLGLDRVIVGDRGDLGAPLKKALRASTG